MRPKRIMVLGATGTAGRATVRTLVARGNEVVCFVRPRTARDRTERGGDWVAPEGAEVRLGEVTDPDGLRRDGFRGERFDVLVSCLASRTGAPADAWAIDHDAHVDALAAATDAGVDHVILLSAICVQKPRLEFQRAKLAFERTLMGSGLDYTIVRPTAFFKSLSGQVDRVKRGKAFLLFGDGRLTSCKPISDDDLGAYLADCVDDPNLRNRVLPIGGPGPAITPRDQGETLFATLGIPPRFVHVPVALLDVVVAALSAAAALAPSLKAKAELARIGRYYATESMLVLDPVTGRSNEDATPSTGSDTLAEHYRRLIRDGAATELGDHAVF